MAEPVGEPAPVVVDIMGTDHGPAAVVEGARRACEEGIPVWVVGDASTESMAARAGVPWVCAPEHIAMHERPLAALRAKKRSSIRVALELVHQGKACSVASFGNSGAVVVQALRTLRMVPGVERPALATLLPRHDGGRLVVLDIGANVDCRPEHLVQFADLGMAWAMVCGVAEPLVGLLSNGEEDSKGNQLVRATQELLLDLGRSAPQIEPGEALSGGCDVLVTDGFVGNVLIKGMEAAADAVRHMVRVRDGGPSMLETMRREVGWDRYGGGLLLGVNGVVVIGHGGAGASAVHSAIHLSAMAARERVVGALSARVSPREP